MSRHTKASRRAAFRRANTGPLAAPGGGVAVGGFVAFDFSAWTRALNRAARTFARIVDDLVRAFARHARRTAARRQALALEGG